MITFGDDPRLPEPHGYRHAALVQGPTIHTSGQTWTGGNSVADAGSIPLVDQTQGAVTNAILALEGAGGGAGGLVALDVFVVGLDDDAVDSVYRGIARAARATGIGPVTTTVLGVAALAVPGALVEVKALGVPVEEQP